MSVFSGPGILTDGLVFDYDMSNTQKSWKGKPAINTCSFGTYDYGYNSTKISNATPPVPPPVTGYPIYKITSNDGNDSQQILYTATVDQVNGGTYTHSAYVYLESGTWVSAGQHWNPWDYGTQQFIPKGVWTRIEDPVTNSTNNYGNIAMCYNTNGAVYVTGSQYEIGSFASPLVNGTRSSTQAIVDLTSRNTITASSLTYASDNTFSFSGSNYLTLPASVGAFGTGNFTINCWWKSSGTQSNYAAIMEQGFTGSPSNGAWAFKITHNTSIINFTYYNGGIVDNLSSVNINDGTWHNYVAVRSGTNLTLYVDGVSRYSLTLPGSYSFGEGSPVFVGYNPRDGSYINGSLPTLSVYNRALSATEIQQNFNALRTRYGI